MLILLVKTVISAASLLMAAMVSSNFSVKAVLVLLYSAIQWS